MMNKLKYLFLSVLCAVMFGVNVPAQTGDKVLASVSGDALRQSEVNRLIDFYEWAFETEFTADERRRYQEFVVEGFRQDAAESRKGANTLIKAYSQVTKKDAGTQADMRKLFNDGFVKDLRAANDETSRLMLGIYERGQRNDGSTIKEVLPSEEDMREVEESPTVSSGGGNIPKDLVGAWFRSVGTGGARSDTNKTLYNSGTDTTFEFFADGKMMVTIKSDTLSIMQCEIHELSKLPGTYSVSGNRLTMNFGTGSVVASDSCKKAGNFKKSLSPSVMTKTFVVKELKSVFRPDSPMILCLDGSSDEDCFQQDGSL